MIIIKLCTANILTLLSCLILLSKSSSSPLMTNETAYFIERDKLVQSDLDLMIGHDIALSVEEESVNDILMAYKGQEMTDGFETLNFLPSKHFFDAKAEIEQSEVFKFIQQMPKGAILHIHDMAMASIEWIISELTYWEDLYLCNSTDNKLTFRFFDQPDATCQWELVSDDRANASSPQDFDAMLFSHLSLYTTDVKNSYPDINSIWAAFEDVFNALSGILCYSKAWESYLTRAMQEMVDDNVVYLEFRGVLPLLYEKDGRIYNETETFAVYASTIQNFTRVHSDEFFGARFIYAPPRLVDIQQVYGYIDLVILLKQLYPEIVAGFDLVGQEDLGYPLTAFIDPLLTLTEVEPPIPFFFHAGETNWEGMPSDENIYDALLLNTSRIGHGYAIAKHPKLMEIAASKGVPTEVCPLSNQVLKLVSDLRNHPASTLAANSFPLVVSSDDPSIWEALPLSHDFYEFFMGVGGAKADLKFLKKLVQNSILYSSLDLIQKNLLESLWQNQWNNFILSFILNKTLSDAEKSNEIPHFHLESNIL